MASSTPGWVWNHRGGRLSQPYVGRSLSFAGHHATCQNLATSGWVDGVATDSGLKLRLENRKRRAPWTTGPSVPILNCSSENYGRPTKRFCNNSSWRYQTNTGRINTLDATTKKRPCVFIENDNGDLVLSEGVTTEDGRIITHQGPDLYMQELSGGPTLHNQPVATGSFNASDDGNIVLSWDGRLVIPQGPDHLMEEMLGETKKDVGGGEYNIAVSTPRSAKLPSIQTEPAVWDGNMQSYDMDHYLRHVFDDLYDHINGFL